MASWSSFAGSCSGYDCRPLGATVTGLSGLHEALLELGLEDWIPLPEAATAPEVVASVGEDDVVDQMSRALLDLSATGPGRNLERSLGRLPVTGARRAGGADAPGSPQILVRRRDGERSRSRLLRQRGELPQQRLADSAGECS